MTAVAIEGEGALVPDGQAGRLVLSLEDDGFTFELGGTGVRRAVYRDLAVIAAQPGSALLVLGHGPHAPRLVCRQLGPSLGLLVRELRDRRLRQRLGDRFVELPDGEPIELVEYEARHAAVGEGAPAGAAGREDPPRAGVAQLACHDRGFVLAPVDDAADWHVVPRSGIERVDEVPEAGEVRVDCGAWGRIRLLRVGPASARHAARLRGLRDAAAADAAALIAALIPDAPFPARDRAARLLVDGHPATPDDLGDAWVPLERAVLVTPPFADSYRDLVAAAGPDPLRWLAIAPERPGSPAVRAWFFVALPGNVVAMELVTQGAHATYCFSAVPPSTFRGEAPQALAEACDAAVESVSRTLVDVRFLREPIALPEPALAGPAYARYRLAIAALPSLAVARRRFVARLVHDEGWSAAVADLIAWQGRCRDDAAVWPGRAAQEAAIEGAQEAATAVSGRPAGSEEFEGRPGSAGP